MVSLRNPAFSEYFKFLGVALIFIILNFSQELGLVYAVILFVDFIWKITDFNVSFRFETEEGKKKRLSYFIETIIAYALFLALTSVFVSVFSPETFNILSTGKLQSIFELLAASTPILRGSKILTLIGWGLIVPLIETSFFNGSLLEGLAEGFENATGIKTSLQKFNGGLILVILIVAALFTLFHLTAKGLDAVALMVTFIFSVISSVLVIRQKSLAGSVLLHVLSNSAIIISTVF